MLSSLALHSDQVIPARAQMGSSLGFHIILACMGIGFPAAVMTAHYLGLRGDTDAPAPPCWSCWRWTRPG